MTNRLFYGDNLDWLAHPLAFADSSVDLVYLDPPFNSNATYNVLFKEPGGDSADSQIEAFKDTWHWNTDGAEAAFQRVLREGGTGVAELLRAMLGFLGRNDLMAYLAMMAARLIELKRVLKTNGSLYLHCDPTASHYLKLLLDGVFGPKQFRTDVIWKRTFAHGNVGRSYGRDQHHYLELPPAEWSIDYHSLAQEGDGACRSGSTSPRRLSASCARLRSCWRRVPRPLRRAGGSRSASRRTTVGAGNMAG